MPDILRPGAGLIFMKVGTHAQEGLDEIIERKRKEIDEAGYAFWGYGGSTCHPLTMVQPFARDFEQRDGAIFLCMQPIVSHHFAEPERATMFSSDGVTWEDIPPEINVLGSRYALAIEDLRREDFGLPLAHTRVAIGNSTGRRGDRYIQGRVDKGCLEITVEEPELEGEDEPMVRIGLTARVTEPYAVLIR
jgi:hypothetical protein